MDKNGLGRLQQRLPSYPNVMGKQRYLNAAVLIPVFYSQGEYHFLFQKRAAHIRQGGEVCFPGGEYEADTDITCREAAIRETTEELGITRRQITILGRLDTFISPRGISVDSFLGELEIKDLSGLSPDPTEVEKIFSIPVSWFEDNSPNEYELELEIKTTYTDENGDLVNILPIEELGLPDKYKHPWYGMRHNVYVYLSPQETVWGITAALVKEVIEKAV